MKLLCNVVKRQTIGVIDQHRPAVVGLYQGDVIGIRLQGERHEYRTSIKSLFHLAVKQEARAERQRREGLSREK